MPNPEDIEYLILHISDSSWGSVEAIRTWHTDPPPLGRGWRDIGYHYIIGNAYPTYEDYLHRRPKVETDGSIWPGRDTDHDGDIDEEIGAHALGYNSKSLGVCFVSKDGLLTGLQVRAGLGLCTMLMNRYGVPVEKVIGHTETGNTSKPCPVFDCGYFRDLLRGA